ncbi:hypothetical protein BD770DRAFT_413477 [Pilaira anomala]|nr:hypothetical protein BD770DRAFT_413477 [Pilaira anomala]
MFSTLSPEVFHIILSNLTLKDKLECKLVSKYWYNIVNSPDQLYETIKVEGKEEFNKLYVFFNTHKKLGAKVKRLSIDRGAIKVDQYRRLPIVFPHVKIFHCVEIWDSLPLKRWKTQMTLKNFARWKDTIVEIREIGSSIGTFALLKGNVCPRLESIDVSVSYSEDEYEELELMSLLVNAPKLTVLKLSNTLIFTFKLDEALDNLPKLKILSFRDVRFINNQLPDYDDIEGSLKRDEDIKPSQLETLIISNVLFVDDAKIWLTYFSKKITSIKNLVWNYVENNQSNGFFDTHEHFLIQFLTKCHQLEFYRVHAFELTSNILKAMTDAGIRLKHIDVDAICDGLKMVLNSGQMDFIETLSISGNSYDGLAYEYRKTDEPDYILKEIGKHPNIKNLRIIQSQQEVNPPVSNKFPFDVVLNDMKHLQTLKMDFVSLILRYESDEPVVETSLTKVHLLEGYFLASRFCSEADLEEEYRFSTAYNKNEDGQRNSLNYVKTILPKTEFIMEQMNMDVNIDISEETYIDFIKKHEF